MSTSGGLRQEVFPDWVPYLLTTVCIVVFMGTNVKVRKLYITPDHDNPLSVLQQASLQTVYYFPTFSSIPCYLKGLYASPVVNDLETCAILRNIRHEPHYERWASQVGSEISVPSCFPW